MSTSWQEAVQATQGRSQQTVLVVDDEDSIWQLITVMLELEGLRVLEAADGQRALEIAANEHLDLITLDVMMPGIDGWQVADELDKNPRTQVIPRLMVSGVPLSQLDEAPQSAHASAVLAKPFDFAEFTGLVKLLLATPVDVPAPRPAAHEV
jgi:CheY-like chemotaxis protein